VFAHAEVGGAVANGGHISSGRIARYRSNSLLDSNVIAYLPCSDRSQIEEVARACYVGHYHKRQIVGT